MRESISEKRIPFTAEDERSINSAATWGMIVSLTSLATGLISLLVQLPTISANPHIAKFIALPFIQAAFTVLINVWLLQASLAFRKVALTDEADQAYLLAGFAKLRAYFLIQLVLIFVGIGLGLLVGLVAPVLLR